MQYDGWQDLKSRLLGIPFNLSILEGSHIAPKDFASLAPALAPLDMPVSIYADIDGPVDSIVVNRFMLNAADNSSKANIVGGVAGCLVSIRSRSTSRCLMSRPTAPMCLIWQVHSSR